MLASGLSHALLTTVKQTPELFLRHPVDNDFLLPAEFLYYLCLGTTPLLGSFMISLCFSFCMKKVGLIAHQNKSAYCKVLRLHYRRNSHRNLAAECLALSGTVVPKLL
jgi:hypothetical protein